ncbi:hypothetical protein A6A04_01345 [Paramagnetospirillum marisnigri]|uniref:DUF2157 domain-containing protein n=1 Tax=Paramagnetospirillum marisnigri TaxID=1285242 RepID=A0A178MUP5_9PROT|nr:hypothetical protein [Paramagnetospirillum marisnigri]OAN52363.1 hypothetical protein A6A04_01345 [Paramagnetospirillum marisnigri]
MYSDDDLDAAVKAGVMPAATATAFRDFMSQRHVPATVDEENLRLITSFNDLFVTIAAVLLLVALGWLLNKSHPALGGGAVAAFSWGFAEYFTRKRRMALPSIALLLAFVLGVFAAALSLVGLDSFEKGGTAVAGCAALSALAAWGHWLRFRVPITVAAGACAAAGALLALGVGLVPALSDHVQILLFLAGLGLFSLAMHWDMRDRERRTRRSDVAFWLHLAAAPMIVHPAYSALGGSDTGTRAALAAVAIYVVLAAVALVVDRRALLVSALAYVLYAAAELFKAAGSVESSLALTALVIGSALLMLSAFWHHARRLALTPLPQAWKDRLPQTVP